MENKSDSNLKIVAVLLLLGGLAYYFWKKNKKTVSPPGSVALPAGSVPATPVSNVVKDTSMPASTVPATLNWDCSQYGTPYIDNNLQIYVNGEIKVMDWATNLNADGITGTDSGQLALNDGDEVYVGIPIFEKWPDGIGAFAHLDITEDGKSIYSEKTSTWVDPGPTGKGVLSTQFKAKGGSMYHVTTGVNYNH